MSVIMRSFAEFMGIKWPRDVACVIDGKPITYAEILEERRAKQKRRLADIRAAQTQHRAAHVWTFFVPGLIYGGWHLYIRTLNDAWWIRECDDLALSVMRIFPCGMIPMSVNFNKWKKTFAQTYSPKNCRKRREGMVAVWVDTYKGHRPGRILKINRVTK